MPRSTDLPQAARSALDPESFEPSEWVKLKQFVEFDAGDLRRLREIGPTLETLTGQITERFCAHLMQFAETREIIEEHELVERMREIQQTYLRSVFGSEYGDDHLRERLRIGLVHERTGFALRWFLGSYWPYLREIVPELLAGADRVRVDNVLSFLKALMLDMLLVAESYLGKTMANVRRQHERLEEIVTERTRKLSQWERLAAVGSMSAKVAHEIRNPLSSISLNTELLHDELTSYGDVDTGEAQDLLASISGELDRLSRIVDEYLQFARMPKLELEPVDLPVLVDDVARFLEGEFVQLGISFDLDAPPDLPQIALDRNQFRQVLLNLFRNAQEAMPAGGALKVRIAEEEGRILLRVQDSGVGIDPTHAQKLFDPFYTTKDSGTGLGLPFVQQVVQELRGEIRIRGEQGRGASFDILIPGELLLRRGR